MFFLQSAQFFIGMLVVLMPAYLLARVLTKRDVGISTAFFAPLILFHAIFMLGIAGVPLKICTVGIILIILTIVLWLYVKTHGEPNSIRWNLKLSSLPLEEKIIWSVIIVAVVLFFSRALSQPLRGWDTFFRWNWLALQMCEYGNFSFYPPITAADYHIYGYTDAIPPLVSFSYFWMYTSFSSPLPELTAFWVTLQFVMILVLVFRITRLLFDDKSALWAVAVAATTPLLFWAVVMGQETGLTALSLLGVIYFLLAARKPDDWRYAVLAGTAAALGALSREYGWAFLLCVLALCIQRRLSLRTCTIYLVVAVSLAGPWYLRTWILSGSPFYSIPVGDLLNVNEVHADILRGCASSLSIIANPARLWTQVLPLLATYALLPLIIGSAGAIRFLKTHYAIVFSVLIISLLWLYSTGSTAGGTFYSMRVLSPALALLSVLAGGAIGTFDRAKNSVMLKVGLAAFFFYGLIGSSLVPANPLHLLDNSWKKMAFEHYPHLALQVAEALQPFVHDSRVLSEDSYIHAAMSSLGTEVVPIWSPEVAFLFDPKLDVKEKAAKLQKLNIKFAITSESSISKKYLQTVPFFCQYPSFSQKVAEGGGYMLFQIGLPQ